MCALSRASSRAARQLVTADVRRGDYTAARSAWYEIGAG
jgi:hypothetical protein